MMMHRRPMAIFMTVLAVAFIASVLVVTAP
jgi:hypothetical protein